MQFILVTMMAILVAAAMAQSPNLHGSLHEYENKPEEKTITEPSVEERAVVKATGKSEEKHVGKSEEKLDDKLPVTIYYEGLCPDSRKLMADLGVEYNSFKNYIKLKFIPFGRSESLDAGGNEFKCHHGPKECLANRIHSCGVEYLSSQDAKQQFVVCQMRTESDQTGKECVEEAGGNWSEISKCIDGDDGKKLQLQAEIDTKEISKPRLENVPTIVFKNEYNSELNTKALKNLNSVFCELLSAENISDCHVKILSELSQNKR